jgi:uncharacterized protein YrrD
MFRGLKDLLGHKVHATDGDVGSISDFWFDHQHWNVRYLVVDTGEWLRGRSVLLSPVALGHPDWAARTLQVALTRQRIQNSPEVTTDLPVARQQEQALRRHYGWPVYWSGVGVLEPPPEIAAPPPAPSQQVTETELEAHNPHLRSLRQTLEYVIHAKDGEIGHVDDVLADDAEWVIRYFAVDTRKWLPGRKVLLATPWIHSVDWQDQAVYAQPTRDEIRTAPEFDPRKPITREYESLLWEHYGRPGYWPLAG